MTDLSELIAKQIRQSGPLPFHQYMARALYEPELGYYASTSTEIGRSGDFYTSPHLHRLFGAMLGRQAIELWQIMGEPGEFHIIEPGAGRGYLALDLLDYLTDKPLYHALRYHIVELNPTLAKRQDTLLSAHADKLHWHSALSEIKGLSGLLLTNELIDALPVHLIEKAPAPKSWSEVYVGLGDEGRLVEVLKPIESEELLKYIETYIPEPPAGYRTEVNLAARAWLKEADAALKAGLILTVDYGYPAHEYYSEERSKGTLLSYFKHTANEDFYTNIGQRDLTAHVNFSALRDWGQELGLKAEGYARQGLYLVSLGLDEVITELYGAEPGAAGLEVLKLQGLIMPGTMGDTHKVLVLSKGLEARGPLRLRGFMMKDQINKL